MLFVKAMILSNIPDRFLENRYLQEFLFKVLPNQPDKGKTLTRWNLKQHFLPKLEEEAKIDENMAIESSDCLTLLLDGWTDISKTNFHAAMLVGEGLKSLQGLIEFEPGENHTAENLLQKVESLLEVHLRNIKACVTDSPSVMVKFRRLLSEKNPNIVTLPCCLHVINLIAQDVTHVKAVDSKGKTVKKADSTLSKLSSLVAFFLKGDFWRGIVRAQQCALNIKNGLQSFCKTRWYGLAILCRSCNEHKPVFEYAIGKESGRNVIKASIKDIIQDSRFWLDSNDLSQVLQPLAELIAFMERDEMNITDVVPSLMKIYLCVKKLPEANTYRSKGK
jgi:hypothetical protein